MNVRILYIIGINVLSFILMGWDKYCATKDYYRISESNLLGLAFFGGSLGTLLGMFTFRHKTKKPIFRILVPIFLVIHIILCITIW